VIRFAFKRLPDQDPLVNGKGEIMPEPNYDGEEWREWEARLTNERADEVVALKKEDTPPPPPPPGQLPPPTQPTVSHLLSVKMEQL
jgi:hypothetical protein